MIKNILLVGLGGFTGSILRYIVAIIFEKRFESAFPWATFTVNILGSLALGLLVGYISKGTLNDSHRLLLAVGVCGSFTTFSTFALENVQLLSGKDIWTSLLYMSASIILGLAAALGGQLISSKF